MLRYILSIFFVAISFNTLAEWREVGVDPKSQITTYADPLTIQKNGNIVQMSHLFDMKSPVRMNSRSYMSLTVKAEYDCKNIKNRTLYATAFSGHMGEGSVVGSDTGSRDWKLVPLGTPKEYLFYIACKRR